MTRKDMSEAEIDQRHAEKMAKKKAARDKILATKTIEKGHGVLNTSGCPCNTDPIFRNPGNAEWGNRPTMAAAAYKAGQECPFDNINRCRSSSYGSSIFQFPSCSSIPQR